jgi:hypothetical protein
VYQPEAEKPATAIDKKYLLGKVVFYNNSAEDYYLTTKMNLIKVGSKGVQIVGKLAKSDSEKFPYIIYNEQKKYIYVAENGDIYDSDGDKVGYTATI